MGLSCLQVRLTLVESVLATDNDFSLPLVDYFTIHVAWRIDGLFPTFAKKKDEASGHSAWLHLSFPFHFCVLCPFYPIHACY